MFNDNIITFEVFKSIIVYMADMVAVSVKKRFVYI